MGTFDDLIPKPQAKDPGTFDDLIPQNQQATATDYLKGVASGVGGLVSGVGYLAEAAGADQVGKSIRGVGDTTQKYWNESMTPAGQRAAQSQVFEDDPGSALPKIGDRWGQALAMGAAQSAPSMLAAAIPGGVAAAGLRGAAGIAASRGIGGALAPLAAGTAAPVGGWATNFAGNLAARSPTALAFGASEGAVAGASNAAQWKSDIEQKPLAELRNMPGFAALEAQIGERAARQQIAEQGAADIMARTTLSTGGIGALTGGGALGSAFQRVTTGAKGGIIGAIGRDAAKEVGQELLQSGGERAVQNVATRDYLDPNQSVMQGVASDALSGAAIGGVMGGVTGGGSYLAKGPLQKAADAAATTSSTIPQEEGQGIPQEEGVPPATIQAGTIPQTQQPAAGIAAAVQNTPAAPGTPFVPVSTAAPPPTTTQAEPAGVPISQPQEGADPRGNETQIAQPAEPGQQAQPAQAADSAAAEQEWRDFVATEGRDIGPRQLAVILGQFMARRRQASGIEAATGRVENARQREVAANRMAVLESLPLTTTGNTIRRFAAALRNAGIRDYRVSPEERRMIARRIDARDTLQPIEQEPTNELTLPEKREAKAVAPTVPRMDALRRKMATPGARIVGNRLLDRHGKRLDTLSSDEVQELAPKKQQAPAKTVAADELDAFIKEEAANLGKRRSMLLSLQAIRKQKQSEADRADLDALIEAERADLIERRARLQDAHAAAREKKPFVVPPLRTPEQPTAGGGPIEQQATALPLGEFGVAKKQTEQMENKPPVTYKGMTVEQMAKVASQHGHVYEDALHKIQANPGRWVNTVVEWRKADIAARLHERKLKRAESFEPNEKQKKVIALVYDSPTYSKDRDLPMAPHNARSTQALLARGALSRIEYGDMVEYRVNEKAKAAEPAASVASRQTPPDAPQQPLSSAGDQQSVARMQSAYNEAKAKLDAIGPEPRKPSSERQAFGANGKAGSPADVVAKYEASVKAYVSWRAKYNRLKKAEVEASNALFAAKKKMSQEMSPDISPDIPRDNSDWIGTSVTFLSPSGRQKRGSVIRVANGKATVVSAIGQNVVDLSLLKRTKGESTPLKGYPASDTSPGHVKSLEYARNELAHGTPHWYVANALADDVLGDNSKLSSAAFAYVLDADNQKLWNLIDSVARSLGQRSSNNGDVRRAAGEYVARTKDVPAVAHPDEPAQKTRSTRSSKKVPLEVAGSIIGKLWQTAVYNKLKWPAIKARAVTQLVDVGASRPSVLAALDDAMTEFARNANGRLGYPNETTTMRALIGRGVVESEREQPKSPAIQDVNMQNRDRSRAASVVQMSDIARNPDYMRLGPSRTPDSGAPMVFASGDDQSRIPKANFGRSDVSVMSDGQRVPFRYAVVDASQVEPSNFADGLVNPAFSADRAGTIKALNNGRVAGLRAAYEIGSAGAYQAELASDLANVGISPDAMRATPNPILVRVYSDTANTSGMAAKSQAQGLGMSPAELARQDAPLLDSSVLDVLRPGDIAAADNRDFVRAFVGKLRQSGQDIAGMMTDSGSLSSMGRQRINAALMQAAYGDADLVAELFDSIDTDIKAIGDALKSVAGAWANMRDSAKLGSIAQEADITEPIVSAVRLIQKARRDRLSLSDLVNQRDIETGEAVDDLTAGALRLFYTGQNMTRPTGKNRLVANLERYLELAMATSPGADMFGAKADASRLIQEITKDDTDAGNKVKAEPSSVPAAGPGSGRGRPEVPGQRGATGGNQPFKSGGQGNGGQEAVIVPTGAVPGPADDKPARPELGLRGQTPEEIAAAEIAAKNAKHDELIAKAVAARKEKTAKDKAEKDRRAADVLKEREAAKKAEVDKAAEEFALGQAAPEPVVKKVTTEEARGQEDLRFSFAGQQSATADQFQLARAKQLLAVGASADGVRQQTGWFKGVDGKWRYEIDDSGASLKAHGFGFGELLDALGKNLTLAEVLDHPALFAAYPSIARSAVDTIDEKSKNNGQLSKNQDGSFTILVNASLDESKALSTLLHEIQHGIQNVEGFASGGNMDQFVNPILLKKADLERRVFAINALLRKSKGNEYLELLADRAALLDERSRLPDEIGTLEQGYKQYRKLAGEVEARSVQRRQNFTADRRKYSDPIGTQDVAPEDVIVMFNGKDAKDAPAPANTTRASAMAAVGASPADTAVFDMASEGKSAQEILSFLSKASRRPFNRVLANALSRIGVSSNISVDQNAGWRNVQNRQGARFAASYSPKTDTVSLFTPREAERHILHEFVHASSMKAIARGGIAARRMQAIFDYVQKTGTMSDQYGMGNFSRFPNETDAQFKKRALDEFVAELFTNPQFQVRLKQLPAPSGSKLKSAWDWVVRVIANMLGMRTKALETALDRALSVGAALLQENAALSMPPSAGARYHTTWHGSPHKFYTFDLSKIGTGEGAQAYGHGLYVAEAPDVALQYSNMRAAPNMEFYAGKRKLTGLEKSVADDMTANGKVVARINAKANGQEWLAAYERIANELVTRGIVYKVDLPAEAIARMLDWDAGLHDNPRAVKIALEKDGWDTSTPNEDMDIDVLTGEDVIRELFDQLGSKQAVSEHLLSIGIQGVRYLDQSSRNKGKGTHNFVLFDDKLARIIEVNGVETGVQPWAPGEWEAAQGGERFSQAQPFSGRETATTPLKPGATTLMVDGVERPALNSNGKPIHWSEEGVRNFWRWFGSSRAVDERGRPLVATHMTGEPWTVYDKSKARDSAVWGKGLYLSLENKWVSGAANNEMQLYIRSVNPLDITGPLEEKELETLSDYVGRKVDVVPLLTMEKRSGSVTQGASDAGFDGIIHLGPGSTGRHIVVFTPEQVKSATGNTGAFSEDPDIRYSAADNWQQSPIAPGNLYQAAKKKAASLLTPERIDKLIYEMQDKFIDLRRIRDHIKEIGGTITDMNDAYLGEELYHKRLAHRTEQFLKEELQPFFADMKALGVTMPEFEKFLHARHAPEANAEMAKRNPNQQQIDAGRQKSAATVRVLELKLQTAKARGLATVAIEKALNDARADLVRWNGAQAFRGTEEERLSLSGMSNAAAGVLMASMTPEQRADMNALAAKVDAINEGTLQALERYGLMDKAALNTWRNTYQHYVPLHRDEAHPDSASHPIGQGFNVRGDASKRRTGSNQEVTNIFGHIAMQREAALTRGEKNRVMQKLYLMARQNPSPDIWAVGKVPMIDTIDKATGFVRSVPDPQYKDKPNVVTLRIGGKDVAIVMNEYNPQALRLAQSIKNLDVDDLHYLIPVVGKATRWFASINTQYNPIFGLINFARDVQTAALNLSTTEIAGKKKEVFKDTMSILGDIIKNKGRMPTAGKWAPIYKEFNEVGGSTGYRDLFLTAEDRSKAVTDEIKALDRGNVSQAAHAVAGWLSDYNEAMENATRLAAYKAAIDNGMSKERAASLAKNLTVNFNRKGRQTRELGALYAFFNAAVQGTARMAQTLSGPAGKKIMLGGVLAGAASAMAGIAAMGGGDGEDDEWSKIPEFVKERSFIIPAGKDKYIAIPMPLGFHFLPNIGRLMVEMAVYKDKTAGKQMASLFTVLADAFNPLGGSAPPMQIIAPTVMDPFVALAQNKDWTGKPIYVENFNSLNPQPGAERAKDSATPIAKGMADAINAVTGGTKYVPGAWSPTPDQIDYVIGQLTGGVGRELGKLSSTIAAPFTGDELPAHKIPLLGRLYGSTSGASGQAEKFYANIKRSNEEENEIKGRRKDGISVDDYLQDNPKAVELAARGNAAERQIRALRQMRSRIVEAGGDDATSKARQINERMATVMRSFNMQVERMQ